LARGARRLFCAMLAAAATSVIGPVADLLID